MEMTDEEMKSPTSDLNVFDLQSGLKNFFCNEKTGVFITCGFSVALIEANNVFGIFDSHKRDSDGLPSDLGTAVLIKFSCIEEVVGHIRRLYSNSASQFELIGIKVNRNGDVRPSEKICEIVKLEITVDSDSNSIVEEKKTERVNEEIKKKVYCWNTAGLIAGRKRKKQRKAERCAMLRLKLAESRKRYALLQAEESEDTIKSGEPSEPIRFYYHTRAGDKKRLRERKREQVAATSCEASTELSLLPLAGVKKTSKSYSELLKISKSPSASVPNSLSSIYVTDTTKSCEISTEISLSPLANSLPSRKTYKNLLVLFEDPPLSGTIESFQNTRGVICFKGCKIVVHREDVFINGRLPTTKTYNYLVSSGRKIVHFEAVSVMSRSSCERNGITHTATLVWIGKKPSLTEFVLSFRKEMFTWTAVTNAIFCGKIMTYYLPYVVIIELNSGKIVFSFRESSEYFSNDGAVPGLFRRYQKVEFKLKGHSFRPGAVSAYDIKMIVERVKASSNVSEDKSTEASSVKKSFVTKNTQKRTENNSVIKQPELIKNNSTEKEEITEKVVSFRKFPANKSRLLNFSGDLKTDFNKTIASTLRHALGQCSIDMNDRAFYALNKIRPVDSVVVNPIVELKISFDAESNDSVIFVVKRAWFHDTTRPSPETNLMADLKYYGTEKFVETKLYRGVITKLPLHDAAIADVNGVPVLIYVESFVTDEDINKNFSTVDEYVKHGDDVILGVSLNTFNGETFYKATNCWKIVDAKSPDSTESRDVSWLSIWGCGDYFIKGRFRRINEQHYAYFMLSDDTEFKLRLDGEGNNVFFVDGYPADHNLIGGFDECDVMLHVAHGYSTIGRKLALDQSLYVSCAWIGDEPSPFRLLKDIARVPPDVIQCGRTYEGVIEDFPLPCYAICRVGTVPVVIFLSEIELLISSDNIKLKKGNRVIVHAEEITFANYTYIFSNHVSFGALYGGIDIFRNMVGFIKEFPNPVGKIFLTDDTDVSFHLYCVIDKETSFQGTVGSLSWFNYLKETLVVGKKVMFSAAKVSSDSDCYEAFEVVRFP